MTGGIEVQITGNEEYGRFIKALFCGDPGSGKTLISSTFPNPVFASAEGGLMSIARRKIPYVKIDATEKLLHLKNAMEQDPEVRAKLLGVPGRIDTVVIDTIDEVARLLVRERLEAQKRDTFQIADWGWLGDQMRGIIRAFRNLDMHVVFTCHLKQTDDGDTGRIYFKPAIQGAVGDEIAGYVDLALLLKAQPVARVVDGESKRVMVRYLKTMPDPSYPWIKDRSGMLPEDVEVNFHDDFDRMHELIFGDMDNSGHIPDVEEIFHMEDSVETFVEEAQVDDAPAVDPEVPGQQPAVSEVEETPPVGPAVSSTDVRAMTVPEKLKLEAPYPCEECEVAFDNEDQRDMSVLSKHKKILCSACYKAAAKK